MPWLFSVSGAVIGAFRHFGFDWSVTNISPIALPTPYGRSRLGDCFKLLQTGKFTPTRLCTSTPAIKSKFRGNTGVTGGNKIVWFGAVCWVAIFYRLLRSFYDLLLMIFCASCGIIVKCIVIYSGDETTRLQMKNMCPV